MTEIRQLCQESISGDLYRIIVSNKRNKGECTDIRKIKVRPVMVKQQLMYQMERFKGTQIFHENYSKEELIDQLVSYLETEFGQMELHSRTMSATVLISKKGKVTIKRRNCAQAQSWEEGDATRLLHNKEKRHILMEGQPVPFLEELGVQTRDGKIVKGKYNKFKQINRYLEFIADSVPELQEDDRIRIVDFGGGKSYLTFALYHYLKVMLKKDVSIIGLDLKEKVIEECSLLASRLGYADLRFMTGDIGSYQGGEEIHMVVSLHACDTATDYALMQAIRWKAKVILAVPCCQHEVAGQIENTMLYPLLKYGFIKEKLASLVTDGIRANLLEEHGYHVQVMEFIDMEHTPKNLLIRAVLRDRGQCRDTGIKAMSDALNVNNTLQKLLDKPEKVSEEL